MLAPRLPQQQSLTEVVDRTAGLIRVSGHLTSLGADLLRGTADGLRSDGHSRVVLDLAHVRTADEEGLDILRELYRDFAAGGGELLIRHQPDLRPDRDQAGTAVTAFPRERRQALVLDDVAAETPPCGSAAPGWQ